MEPAMGPIGIRRPIQTDGVPAASFTAQIKSGITHHPEQPGLKRALSAEAPQMSQGLDETILHGIQRIRLLAEQSIRNLVSHRPIPAEKVFQDFSIPGCKTR
jgi:hypothetical protein